VNDRQRERLLDRVRRPSSAIGAEMPDEITVEGRTVDLRELLFECDRLEAIPESERERLEAAKAALRRERLERKQRIARDEVDYEEGERLVGVIRGLDRALTALEGLDEPDIGEELRQKRLEDARELLTLIGRRP
jgi:hypothetical protein